MIKRTILLLGHNCWQERSLELMLRLGGYEPRVVNDSLEAINVAKSIKDEVHSILLPANGNHHTLIERLDTFSDYGVSVEIVLVGITDLDLAKNQRIDVIRDRIRLSACHVEQLMDYLGQ